MEDSQEIVKMDMKPKSTCQPGLEKVFGVAILGAFGAVALYYLYLQLGDDTRCQIRQGVVSTLKGQLHKWTAQQ